MLRGNGRGLTVLVSLAAISAASEAFLLTALVEGATALGGGESTIGVSVGPVSREFSVSSFLAIALAAAVVRALCTAGTAVVGPRVTGASRERHRRNLLEAYVRATWDAQAADRTGRLQQVFSTSINEVNAIVLTTTSALTALVTLAVLLVVAFVLSQVITGVLLLFGVLIYLSLRSVAVESRRAARVDSDGRVASASHVSVVAAAGAEIRVLGAGEEVAAVGRERIDHAERAFAKSNALRQLSASSVQSLAFVVASGGLVAASVFDIPVDFAVLGTIALLLLRAAGQANQVQQALGLFGQLSPFVAQVRELTQHFADHQQRWGSASFPDDFDIVLRDVKYSYPGAGRTVLDIPSTTIEHGTATAILGPSGSGKSTLIQLLLRLRPPTSGHVLFGGVDASEIGPEQFATHVSFVPQAPHLIPGTVRENIRFFRPSVTDQQIEECARLAHVHDEIMQMPAGYETALDAHVDMLSGGQKQRISLARALATDPSILVLDEPTSALDPRNESLVIQTLAEMRRQRTVVIITHRESTIAHCDVVLNLDRGRVEVRRAVGETRHSAVTERQAEAAES